jgi:hypothetical protein
MRAIPPMGQVANLRLAGPPHRFLRPAGARAKAQGHFKLCCFQLAFNAILRLIGNRIIAFLINGLGDL